MWIDVREGARKQEKANRKFLDYDKTKAHSRKLNRKKGVVKGKTTHLQIKTLKSNEDDSPNHANPSARWYCSRRLCRKSVVMESGLLTPRTQTLRWRCSQLLQCCSLILRCIQLYETVHQNPLRRASVPTIGSHLDTRDIHWVTTILQWSRYTG